VEDVAALNKCTNAKKNAPKAPMALITSNTKYVHPKAEPEGDERLKV